MNTYEITIGCALYIETAVSALQAVAQCLNKLGLRYEATRFRVKEIESAAAFKS